MKLIVGLGNPGSKYKNTRHNIGREVIERLAEEIGANWKANERLQADIAVGHGLTLVRPHVFMNDSGLAVQAAAAYYKVESQDILVIHDEADLPLGEIRVQQERGSAGHNGVQSIIHHLKTKDFMRVRIGIRSENMTENRTPASNIVLQKFTDDEQELVQETIKKAIEEIMVLRP